MSTLHSHSLCGLPTELKLDIVEFLYEWGSSIGKEIYGRLPGDVLIPLSCTSHDWHNITLPYLFRKINISEETNEVILGIYNMVASKYGRHCRSLDICLQHDRRSILASDSRKELDTTIGGRYPPWTWQVKRNALLFGIVQFMPNLEQVKISINDCQWHPPLPPCGCLGAYGLLTDSLAGRALKSIFIDFNYAYSSQNGNVALVARLLLGIKETVESVRLFHDGCYGAGDFAAEHILDILQDLPRLRELLLAGICSFVDLSDRTWVSALQNLAVRPYPQHQESDDEEDAANNDDIFHAFESLPATLHRLVLGEYVFTDSFNPQQNGFLSNLTLLKSLVFNCDVSDAVFAYFRTSKLHTLELHEDFDLQALSQVLKDNTAFPCLKTLFVSFPTGILSMDSDTPAIQAADELLSNACKARAITYIRRTSAGRHRRLKVFIHGLPESQPGLKSRWFYWKWHGYMWSLCLILHGFTIAIEP